MRCFSSYKQGLGHKSSHEKTKELRPVYELDLFISESNEHAVAPVCMRYDDLSDQALRIIDESTLCHGMNFSHKYDLCKWQFKMRLRTNCSTHCAVEYTQNAN